MRHTPFDLFEIRRPPAIQRIGSLRMPKSNDKQPERGEPAGEETGHDRVTNRYR